MSPSEYTVQRSTAIHAPAAAIYPHLIDLQAWQGWSPWEDLDPDIVRDYSEPSTGIGATYAWQGNRKAGEGRMAITSATEPTQVKVDLFFMKPFKSASKVTFDLSNAAGSTTVTWTMTGPRPLLLKVLSPIMSMDKIVGKDFEKGLARLKALSEGAKV